jgi:hypothetical protein
MIGAGRIEGREGEEKKEEEEDDDDDDDDEEEEEEEEETEEAAEDCEMMLAVEDDADRGVVDLGQNIITSLLSMSEEADRESACWDACDGSSCR